MGRIKGHTVNTSLLKGFNKHQKNWAFTVFDLRTYCYRLLYVDAVQEVAVSICPSLSHYHNVLCCLGGGSFNNELLIFV